MQGMLAAMHAAQGMMGEGEHAYLPHFSIWQVSALRCSTRTQCSTRTALHLLLLMHKDINRAIFGLTWLLVRNARPAEGNAVMTADNQELS
jgi:hypothetical protein